MRKKTETEKQTLMIFPKSIVPLELTVCKYRSSTQQSEHQKININNYDNHTHCAFPMQDSTFLENKNPLLVYPQHPPQMVRGRSHLFNTCQKSEGIQSLRGCIREQGRASARPIGHPHGCSWQTLVLPGRTMGPGSISAKPFCWARLWSPILLDGKGQGEGRICVASIQQ